MAKHATDVVTGPPFLHLSLKGLLFSLTLTSAIQAKWSVVSLFPWPEVRLDWPVNLLSVAIFVLSLILYKCLVWALPLATLLVYLEWVLPIHKASVYFGKVMRVLKMSSGYEKVLMPYLGAVLPHIHSMVENVDYVEPVFPEMVKYMHVFGPHLSTVLPNLGKMGPFLGQMMPLMPRMEPFMADFMPHLVDVLPHFPIMILYMEDFLPYFDKIVPNLGELTPHMGPMMKHIDKFMPHMPIIMRNFHYLVPHIGKFMEHIEVLLPTLDKTMPYLDGLAPHFDAMVPALERFVPIMDKVVDHLPAIIPRLGDTLVNADAVLDYLGWTVNTPLVNSLEMHGTGSTVVKLGRALGGGGGGGPSPDLDPSSPLYHGVVRRSRHASEVAVSLLRQARLEERIVKEGWIKKRSTSAIINSLAGKAWKRKWCVVDVSGCMSVYKDPSKSPQSLRMRWYLGGSRVVPQEEGKAFKLKVPARGELSKMTHYFRVPKGDNVRAEYESWISHLSIWAGTEGDSSLVEDEGILKESDDEDEVDEDDDDGEGVRDSFFASEDEDDA